MERRKYRRIEFNAPVFIESRERVTFGEVHDISNMGAFIKTAGSYEPDEQVVTSIYFVEGGATLSVSIPGTVARITSDGIGFHSPHLDIYSLLHLEHLLVFNRGDAQNLTDDFYGYVLGKDEMVS